MKHLILTIFCLISLQMLGNVPRPEYPRPQFERKDWQSLNGEWSFAFDFSQSGMEKKYPASQGFDSKITVPFAPESDLSGIGHKDFINDVWYQRDIAIPSDWEGKRVKLNFGAVYYESEVFIDGKFVGRHFGGSDPFSYDITDFVSDGQPHSLVVHAKSDIRGGEQPGGKQSTRLDSYGCFYTRTTGIWQPVWMEAVDKNGLERVQVLTDIDEGTVTVIPTYYGLKGGNSLTVSVRDGNKTIASKQVSATQGIPVTLSIKNPKLWSPESPYLYDVVYEVKDSEGKTLDRVESYLGMRKVHIDGNKIFLNNEPYYQRLVLDQGFYPDGVWTAPSDEALRHDIEISKAAGFNGARLHQKAFEERFHYWADKLGYLVWGEMPSWDKDASLVGAARNFLPEWQNLVVRDRNHPALIVWTPFNEEWDVPTNQSARFYKDVYEVTRQLDPTRPINTISGGLYVISDFCTAHNYAPNGDKLREMLFKDGEFYQPQGPTKGFDNALVKLHYDGSVPYILDEFGGVKCGETNPAEVNSWGYGNIAQTREDFYNRLQSQVDAITELSDKICGFCYTQLTDVEQEQNGLFYFNRGEKFDLKRLHDIFTTPVEGYQDK